MSKNRISPEKAYRKCLYLISDYFCCIFTDGENTWQRWKPSKLTLWRENKAKWLLIRIVGGLFSPFANLWNWLMTRSRHGHQHTWKKTVEEMCSWQSTSVRALAMLFTWFTGLAAHHGLWHFEKRERIVTLALLFNSFQRLKTQKLFWRAGGTRWKMTFNCTSLAESHPIRALYIFPNSSWWGRAYERARPTGVAMQRDGCLAPEER